MPVWQSIYEELKDQDFEIISFAQDTGGEAAAGKIFDDGKVTYTSIIDVDHSISSLYNLVNVPSAVWVDEAGRIVRINEGAYAEKHKIGTFEFGTNDYAPALRDWVEKGDKSQYVWSSEKVVKEIRPRSSEESLGEPTFKLANYFFKQGDTERANKYWDRAQALHPDSWNFHRQDWSFLPPAETNRNFLRKTGALTKPYYAPLQLGEGTSEE